MSENPSRRRFSVKTWMKFIAACVFAAAAVVIAGLVGFAAASIYVESRPPGTEWDLSLVIVTYLIFGGPPLATFVAMIFFVRDVLRAQRSRGSTNPIGR